jgi:hypothetical protein
MASKEGIGQHRATPGAMPNSGQRQTRDSDAHVGNLSGGENQMNVPAPRRDGDISTAVKE